MFVITPNTLSLALGVLDINYNYYIDNTLFTIQGVHKTKKNVYNSTTGKYDQVFNSKVFSLVNCTDDHVPDPQLREFFLKSEFYMHQCIPKDLVVEIEGQFNSDSYQELNFYFYKCSGQGCKDEKEIDALVDNNYIELLFTDVYFAPENKDDPFIRYSRDLYWITSQNLPREVNVFMRNNYVESDLGWVTSDISTQTYPSFSYSDNQIVDTSNGFFFHLVVRFEKEKENLYKRTYDNLFTIMSQIGGFSQILLTIFSFLCLRYSQIHLARSLINQSFDFQDITNKPNQGILISNPTQQQNNTETIENQAPQNRQINKFYNPSSIKDNSYQLASAQRDPGSPVLISDHKDSKDYYTQRNDHEDVSQQISKRHTLSAGKQLTDEQILNDYNKQQEINQNRSNLNFNIFSYMLSFISKLIKSFRNKKQVIDYGFKEIDNNLDIEYIIKKFVEIDKLKRIILNDDQLALFNYIPKPQILYKVDKQGVVIEKNSFFNKDDNLNDFEKFKQAKQSFKNIFEKQKPTKIDYSILNLLDAKQYEILCNQLDKNQFQQKYMQKLSEIQFSKNIQSQSHGSPNLLVCKNNIDLEEQIQIDKFKSDDFQLQNKLNRYSTHIMVRNPSIYSSITNQEQIQGYMFQDAVEENL
ncbi:ATPase, histidine kinase-, DNA gyrase B (macronuclear) [Tetrahymena thermophila SB210]|uniref:ATPase, histidine kinase-, DNA gyrase B n=1 Tax=Tetrahymena thermophila (strain SB210) TaxID=312017 RepID=Q22KG0_TETTS|nr:ATPase, histidine kinase-, DNA gyrase B [Tetrahymena thermophila SB210]EAR85839.2 ATPase, histidine kinase-, DNA gyrase B [Tetrahymena thermophila SB210]|eukprot:XP_001033502.2 ATPase, histidine kinase-, DNA gyrase B [Tetrahymena thermophila SB210]